MKFAVKIIETLTELVEVEAKTTDEALEIAKRQYYNETWVLDSGNFEDVEFLLLETDESLG